MSRFQMLMLFGSLPSSRNQVSQSSKTFQRMMNNLVPWACSNYPQHRHCIMSATYPCSNARRIDYDMVVSALDHVCHPGGIKDVTDALPCYTNPNAIAGVRICSTLSRGVGYFSGVCGMAKHYVNCVGKVYQTRCSADAGYAAKAILYAATAPYRALHRCPSYILPTPPPATTVAAPPLSFNATAATNGTATTAGTGNATMTGAAGNATTTEAAGNATTTGPAGNATTTGPAGNATTAGPAGNATTTGPAGNATTTGQAVNATTAGPAGNATTTGPAGNATTTEPAGNATTTGPAGNATPTAQAVNPTPTGNAGYPAPTGHAGYPIPTGHAGYPAPTGHAGYPAPTGHHGYPVPTGHAGFPGHAGYPGHHGYPAPTGHAGYPGHVGYPGHHGYPAPTWHAGYPAPTGHAGYPAPTGHQGYPAPTGHHGYPKPTVAATTATLPAIITTTLPPLRALGKDGEILTTTAVPRLQLKCFQCESGDPMGPLYNERCSVDGEVSRRFLPKALQPLCTQPCYTRVNKLPLGSVTRGCGAGLQHLFPGGVIPKRGCHRRAGEVWCFCDRNRCNMKDMENYITVELP